MGYGTRAIQLLAQYYQVWLFFLLGFVRVKSPIWMKLNLKRRPRRLQRQKPLQLPMSWQRRKSSLVSVFLLFFSPFKIVLLSVFMYINSRGLLMDSGWVLRLVWQVLYTTTTIRMVMAVCTFVKQRMNWPANILVLWSRYIETRGNDSLALGMLCSSWCSSRRLVGFLFVWLPASFHLFIILSIPFLPCQIGYAIVGY